MNFSIVVPFFNNVSNLETLYITLSDYFEDPLVEIIILDDNSHVDNFSKLLVKFKGISNIKISKNSSNLGPALTRNKGVDISIGDYIFFLDADDGWCKNKAYTEYENNIKNNIKFSGSKAKIVDINDYFFIRQEEAYSNICDFKHVIFTHSLFTNPFSTPSVCIKREIILNNKFDPNMRYSEDIDCWRHILIKNSAIQFNEQCTYIFKHPYLSGGNSLSTNTFKMTLGSLKSLLKLFFISDMTLLNRIIIGFAFFYDLIKGIYREFKFLFYRLRKKHV